ncbi:hypothetical protein BGZ95_007020 [Linnemannia exigua]|uniref:Uncharacterized protein n=1 Tax=Linnemannia exigua TaxID=604196 RepID=A0AAD4DFY8_9FUNG|nr:hypothetical protein BGZ95_007020 [Linnemannia exigua]
MAPRSELEIAAVALVPRAMHQEVDEEKEGQKGGRDGSMMTMMAPRTKGSTVLLAQFSLTRAEIGSFRQLKTSTREKDYCACIFEQQQQQQDIEESETEENKSESDPLETTVTFGSVQTTQPIPRSSRSTCTTTTASTALPVSATTTSSYLSYLDSPLPQACDHIAASPPPPPSSSPCLSRQYNRGSSSFSTSEEQQQQQQRQIRRPITAWLCLACGGPALELPQRWIKRISYTASTRLLRISVCDSAFSSYEGVSWRSSYKSDLRCEDPTSGELNRVRTIDLCLSRLVEPKVIYDLLAKFPSELVSPSVDSSSSLPSPLPNRLHHRHLSSPWRGGQGKQASCSASTDCSPKMSPLGMLSPSLSEDTVWLSSSGGGTPDHFSRPYHQHPQHQALTDSATDLMMRHQQQQQLTRHDDNAPDDDPEDSHNYLGKVEDGDRYYRGDYNNTTSSSASVMSILMINHPRLQMSSPVTEKYQHPQYNHTHQLQQEHNQQCFTQRGLCSQSNPFAQDNAYNTLIRGIETCRGRAANSRQHQQQRSESNSGNLSAFSRGEVLPLGIETQPSERQVLQSAKGKNQQGGRQYDKQESHSRQPQQHQQQGNSGNGGSERRRKDQRRFSTSRQNNNFNFNQQYQRQPIGVVISTAQDQQHPTVPSPYGQQSSTGPALAAVVVAEETILQAAVPCRRRCISSGDLDPEPIAPIMPPSVCTALRRRHARRMSCDGRLETYLNSLLGSLPSRSVTSGAAAATIKVSVSSQSNSHRLLLLQQQQQQQQQQRQHSIQSRHSIQNHGDDNRVQSRGRGRTQGSINDAQYRSKRNSLTISTDFPKDSLRDTSMSSVSDVGSDRRASISSSISDISISLSHSTTLSSSSSSTSLSLSSCDDICARKGGPPVHYTLMCWIGGRWPCRLRPLIKKSTLNDVHAMLRRNLKLPPNYFIDIEFEWQGQTYMIMDATHWQWAREQVRNGDMAIRCKIWQKRFTR